MVRLSLTRFPSLANYPDYTNSHGNNVLAKVLLVIVSVLNAGRNSFSFFLLLIVCMGYGVVKPSLGKTMTYIRFLAITHFVFGVIYAVASLTITPDDAGPIVLLVILPLAATLTAFYVWTLNSLNLTMKDLVERKQSVKAMMYKKLWWCILASIMVIFGFFFLNSFSFAGRSDPDFVPDHWKTRWFILDGWLNLVYFIDITYVAYLWRPTANNRRFAMSDEVISQPLSLPSGFPIPLTIHSRSHKMTKVSKSLRLVVRSTRRMLGLQACIPQMTTTTTTTGEPSLPFLPGPRPITITRAPRSTAKRYSLLAKTPTSGPKTTFPRKIPPSMHG